MEGRKDYKTMEINQNVIIQNLTPKAKKRHKRLWGVDFEGKKGKIVELLINSRGEKQGYRIRFPVVKIAINEDGGSHQEKILSIPFIIVRYPS